MKHAAIALGATALFAAASAFVPPAAAQPRGDRLQPTKMEALAESLEHLLNGGYAIVAMGGGGLQFTLRREAKWAMCEVRAVRPAYSGVATVSAQSECWALN